MKDAPDAPGYLKDIKETLTSSMLATNRVYGRRLTAVRKVQLQEQVNVEPPHPRGEANEPTKPQDPTASRSKCKPRRQRPCRTTSPKDGRGPFQFYGKWAAYKFTQGVFAKRFENIETFSDGTEQ